VSVLTHTPLFSAFDVRTTGDAEFLTLSLDSLPTSQFVNLGEGLKAGTARMSIRRSSCSMIGGLVMAEVASAALWDGAHTQVGMNYFGIQVDARVRLLDTLDVERQMIDGTINDAKGFPGAKQIAPFSGGVFDMTETAPEVSTRARFWMLATASARTAGTASSVYPFVSRNLGIRQLVWGNDAGGGAMFRFTDIRRQFIAPDSNKPTRAVDICRRSGLGSTVGLSRGGWLLG